MIRYEIKKIFSKSLSKVSLVVLLFSLLISCYFAITNVSFLDEQGKSHTGIAAAKSLREEKQKWKGVLDEAALQAVLYRVVPKKQSDPDNYLRMKNYHSY